MVTNARRVAKPVSLVILMLFAVGPGLVSAGPQSAAAADATAADAATDSTSDAVSTPIAAPSRPRAAYSWVSPAGPAPDLGSHSLGEPPLWMDSNAPDSAPAKTGSW
jgi:hypothetical protein